MAFGKKKDEAAAAVGDLEAAAPVNLFEEDPAEDEDDPVPAGAEAAARDMAAESAAAAAAAEARQAADPLAGDALFSLFGESEAAGDDRAAALDLAGDVEMSDLIDDLRTVAVALRIDISTYR